MSSTAQNLLQRHRLTISDYHRMSEAGILHEDSRVELIEGELIDMAPIGSHHAGTVFHLSNLLNLAVGSAAFVWVQNPIILIPFSGIDYDFFMTCDLVRCRLFEL